MTPEERKDLAEAIAAAIEKRQTPPDCHAFSIEERETIRDLAKAKKKAIQTTFWVVGMLFLWVAKEVWEFFFSHIAFNWPGK